MSGPRVNMTHLFGGATLLSPADALAIYDLYRRCDDYFLVQDGQNASLSDADSLFSDVPSSKTSDDQFIVGCWQQSKLFALGAVLTGYPEIDDWYIGLLLIDPSMRSQGHGQRLFSAIERCAAEDGARRLFVNVLVRNQAALSFWKRLGFAEVGATERKTYKSKVHFAQEMARSLID